MTTIEISDADIQRTVDRMAAEQDEPSEAPMQLTRAAQAAFKRARAAGKTRDAECAVQVAEYAAKRDTDDHKQPGCDTTQPPTRGGQSTLFDF